MNEDELTDDPELRDDPEWSAVVFERSKPGWWRVSGPFPQLFVSCQADDRGRVILTSILVAPEGREVGSVDLRRIPLSRIVAGINQPHARSWAESAPDEVDIVRQLHEAADEGPGQVLSHPRRRERLHRPPSQGSDEFYGEVAEAYRFYAQRSTKPAVEISAEASVPVTTARRWISEARRRGHLDPGQRGRVTG